jgi:trans-L-3-hydroxyproline dehydratase
MEVEGIGRVRYDVAFGGAFYAFCRAEELGVGLSAADFQQLIALGRRIKQAVMETLPIHHPFEPEMSFLYGTIIVGDAHEAGHHSRNVCIFADGEVDRSPTGTGVSARAALHYARGEISIGERFTVESILGTCFTGEVVEATTFGPHAAVIPRVSGMAYMTGRSEWVIDAADPLRSGFMLR